MEMRLDPFSELAGESARRARSLVTARLSAFDFSREGEAVKTEDMVSLWSPTLSSIAREIFGEEGERADVSSIEDTTHLLAALAYLTVGVIAEFVVQTLPGASSEQHREKALAIWQEISTVLSGRGEGPHF